MKAEVVKKVTAEERIEYIDKLAPFVNLIKAIKTPHLDKLLHLPHKIIFIVAGNQGSKTHTFAMDCVYSILGIHPNLEHNRCSRQIRCLSSSLPEATDPEAQDNTQYLELKKLLPYENILKDITARSQTMTVSGHQGKHYIEFKSTKQEVQDTGKVQRDRLWADEEPSKDHWNESRMRLHASNGLTMISLTPINGLSWLYDDIYMRASYFWRSKVIQEYTGQPEEEINGAGSPQIAVLHIATDDNPTLTKQSIDNIFEGIDDPDELAVRRYGIFKQISGRIHKAYNPQIHYIPYDKYFPGGMSYEWMQARGIDYHESRTPWSVLWLGGSPQDEWFVHQEYHPPIDGPNARTTEEICRHIVRNSGDYQYICNLIDPLAGKKQPNTGFSVIEDMNRIFSEIRRDEGLGVPTFWEPWDTKDTKGQEEVRKRLKNAAMVGKPFANISRKHGQEVRHPTLWICNTCPDTHKSFLRWSYEEWATIKTRQVKDAKPQRQQKHSHDPITVECMAKDIRLRYRQKPFMQRQQYDRTGRPVRIH